MKRRQKIHLLPFVHPSQALGVGAVALCVGMVAVLLLMEKTQPQTMNHIRSKLVDVTAPVAHFLAAPKQAVSHIANQSSQFFSTYRENARLRQENAALLQWQSAAHQMAKENTQLRELMRLVPDGTQQFVTAHMVAAFGHGTRHTALISAGMDDGVKKHLAVIAAEGLVGRVIEVGKQNARVLLITDVNANIPVVSERSGQKAILTGHRDSGMLRLELMDKADSMLVGDRLVTSGDGGMIPAGIPVANITSISGSNVFAVPFADVHRSNVVTVVDYRF